MSEDSDIYWRATLDPADTGLPMVVQIERGHTRDGVRLKVGTNTATIAICPVPRVVTGHLRSTDLHAVSQWIQLNLLVILDYWDGTITAAELLRHLQRLDEP
jgi:hypothetical protein